MKPDPILSRLTRELQTKHRCQTVILYGSRARGDARSDSDYDLLGIRKSGPAWREARRWDGVYRDIFIYPESKIARDTTSLLHVRGGVVLCEKGDSGRRFLARLEKLFKAGPKKLPRHEIDARKIWAAKMLERIKRGDIEENYRRVWLLTALLEDYFHFRSSWYLGPKESLGWLKKNDPGTYAAFRHALQPGARLRVIAKLVKRVTAFA